MPEKAILKSSIKKLWHVKVGRIDNELFFQNGWDRFVQDNSVEPGDFLVFRYNGDYVFDVKILGNSGCEKGVTGTYVSIDKRPSYIKEEEDAVVMDEEEQKIEVKEEEGEEEEEDDDDDNDDNDDYKEEEEEEEDDKEGGNKRRRHLCEH